MARDRSVGESVLHKRCFHHASRRAAARCPQCMRFYCRECVTEHLGRVICATCLKELVAGDSTRRRVLSGLCHLVACTLSLLAAWMVFYHLGRMLLLLPGAFHEGTLWSQ